MQHLRKPRSFWGPFRTPHHSVWQLHPPLGMFFFFFLFWPVQKSARRRFIVSRTGRISYESLLPSRVLCPGPQGCQSSGTQKALAPFEDRAVLPTLAWDSAPWRNRAFLALSRRKTLIPVIPNFVSWPLIITALPRMHKISQENISFFLSSYLLDTEVQTCPKWIDIIFYLQAAILTDPSFFPPQLPGASQVVLVVKNLPANAELREEMPV